MKELFELFARAGGSVSLSEFSRLTPEDQQALVTAVRAERVRLLVEIALAVGNPLGAANLLAEIDGGAALQKAEILEAMRGK